MHSSQAVNIPEIYIPSDVPDDLRQMVEEVNRLLREITEEIAEINRNPESVSQRHRLEVVAKSEQVLNRFQEMREQLRSHCLEWSEWPDVIG